MFPSLLKSLILFFWRNIRDFFKSNYIYVKDKIRFKKYVHYNITTKISSNSTFEGANVIGDNTKFCGNMGYGTYICNDCSIIGNIGRFTSIAADVKNAQGVHPITAPYATTSPMFFSLKKQSGITFAKKQLFDEMRAPISIGNDCWIGQRAFFVGGLTIGDGAVILAGAVVTKDVPPYAIVGGVPAKILKYRYDEETIQFLLEKKWWNMPVEWLKENSALLCDIDKLKETLKAM
jgi:acetyltransferase-like isoleucine patch superfamily enzyme